MTKQSLVFLATPFGAVIGAIGLALGAMISYLKGSEEGQNRLNKITMAASIIWGNLMDIVQAVGKAVYEAVRNPQQAIEDFGKKIKEFVLDKFQAVLDTAGLLAKAFKQLFAGEFSAALDTAGEAAKKFVMELSPVGLVINAATSAYEGLKSIIEETNKEISKGIEIENLRASTDKLERYLVVQREVLNAKIAENKLKSEDKSLDLETRIALIREAKAMQDELNKAELTVAQNRLKIKETENSFSNSTKEALDEEAELRAKLFRIQKDNADKSKEMFTKEQELRTQATAKELADIEKKHQAEHNLSVFRLEQSIKETDDFDKRLEREIELEEFKMMEKLRFIEQGSAEEQLIIEQTQAAINALYEKTAANKMALAKKAADEEKKIEQLKTTAFIGITDMLFKKQSGVRFALMGLFKQQAIFEAFASTKAGAISAYKSLAGIPIVGPALGIAAAAAVSAYGLLQVATLTGMQLPAFARGGRALSGQRIRSGDGVPIKRSNGDDLLATVKTNEVILNEDQQRALGGDKVFRKLGVPGFNTGGYTSLTARSIADEFDNNDTIVDLAKAILNQPRPVLVMEEFEAKQSAVNEVKDIVQII
jgi:hypothetical protein